MAPTDSMSYAANELLPDISLTDSTAMNSFFNLTLQHLANQNIGRVSKKHQMSTIFFFVIRLRGGTGHCISILSYQLLQEMNQLHIQGWIAIMEDSNTFSYILLFIYHDPLNPYFGISQSKQLTSLHNTETVVFRFFLNSNTLKKVR